MSEIVVFLEFREDAEYFTEHVAGGLDADNYQIVVLSDDASFHLAEKNIPFIHMEELLSPTAEGELCGSIWNRLETFCEYVDNALADRLDFLEKGAPYLSAQIDVLNVLFDALILKIEVLRNAFERFRPKKIYFARNDLVQPTHHRLFFDESFSLNSVLLEFKVTEIAGYGPEIATWESRYDLGNASGSRSKWWFRTARALNHIASSLRQSAIGGKSELPKVCVVGGSERSLQIVVENLRESGAAVTVWRPQTVGAPPPVGTPLARAGRVVANLMAYRRYRAKLENAWRSIADSPHFRAFLIWKDVDFSDIVIARIRVAVVSNAAHQQVSMNEARRLLKNIDILLSSYYSSFERPVAYIARKMNKIVVSVQHGAMGHDGGGYGWGLQEDPLRASNKGFFYTDMAEVDVKLAWGEAAAKEMSKWRFGERHPRVETIGAPHLVHLRGSRGVGRARKRILFVSNTFGNNTYMLMNFRGLAYRRDQYRMLHALAAHPADHEIIYKAYSSWSRNEVDQMLRTMFPSKRMTRVGGERRLPELFREVDCVILDLPTTGFYEACVTDLPVFLFNRSCEFSESVKGMISRRVYYSEDIQEFCGMLDKFQSQPDDFPALKDDAFIRSFSDVDSKPNVLKLISGER